MIRVEHISKQFKLSKEALKQNKRKAKDERQNKRIFQALSDVSFSCDKGQVLGLLGANGAGKTTTLRILASALSADSGHIYIDGSDVSNNPIIAKKNIGFLSSKTGLYNRLTALENIEYFGKLHGFNKKQLKLAGEPLYAQLGIEDYLHRRVDTLSSGMTQKISIARAVIHQPKVVVFDEPTTGLDIMATEVILEFIQQQKDKGIPVIFSTHHLDEVQALADKVAIIDKGKSCFNGSIDELKLASGQEDLRAAFKAMITIEQGEH